MLSAIFNYARREDTYCLPARGDVNTTSSERRNFVARAEDDAQDAELFRVLAYTGLRLGEARTLQWGDVDFKGRRLIVQRAVSRTVEGPTKGWQVATSRSPTRHAMRSSDSSRARTSPSATTTSSAAGSAAASTAQRCDADITLPAKPPACAT